MMEETPLGFTFLTGLYNTLPPEKDFLLFLNVSIPIYDGGMIKEDVVDKTMT